MIINDFVIINFNESNDQNVKNQKIIKSEIKISKLLTTFKIKHMIK